jgi:DHA1 family tetracycline resistance protein-like MFS transporter
MAENDTLAGPGRNALTFVLLTVGIDAMGFGIIIPVMPELVREVSNTGYSGAALWGGYLSFSYAVMQFLFGPTIGNLSDRFGRRPVLLVSLAVLAADFLIMAVAPSLLVLFIGRIMAGMAAATHSTAHAFVADISAKQDRAKNFGLIGAAFGVGFILGPIIGGVAGEFGTRAPFYAATGLAFLNFCYGVLVLPETLSRDKRRPFDWRRANPLGGARQIAKFPVVAWFLACAFLFEIANFVYPAVWGYYTKEAHGWSSAEVGFSLAIVGLGFVIVQGWLLPIVLAKIGEIRTVLAGFLVNIIGLVGLAFATADWMVYAWLPVIALGAVIGPALLALMSNLTPDNSQGELQGLKTSVVGITMIISPLMMTQLFGYFSGPEAPVYFPGAPFMAAAGLIALALIPFAIGLRRKGL